jgi:flagellar M-ring protein FliF
VQKQIASLQKIATNISKLGPRRIIVLSIIGVSVLALTLLSAFLLNRPVQETLYANLDRTDISKISSVLNVSGIRFEIAQNGSTISVPPGMTSRARMILAERGLPSMSGSGYELFDKVGSLGMTSFMQEVTRLRATGGELARTIQLMRGIRAARVHIVMGDEGSFRKAKQPPSVSVIMQTDASVDAKAPTAKRHLVSAALPGMKPQLVTIIGSDGTIFASQDDETEAPSTKARVLERTMASEITENVRRTLAPYLSLQNFQLSVAVRLNIDKKQVTETIFDPNSRVERSVRVMRETQAASNAGQQGAVTVERNIPQEAGRANSGGRTSNEESQKREETTNYEVSSKVIQSVSGGYAIENLSLALLINRVALAGPGSSDQVQDLATKLSELEGIVASASGLRRDRGDIIKTSVVDFSNKDLQIEPEKSLSIGDFIIQRSSSFLNAFISLCIVLCVIIFVVQPALRILAKDTIVQVAEPPMLELSPSGNVVSSDRVDSMGVGNPPAGLLQQRGTEYAPSPKEALDRMVSENPEKAALMLKKMIERASVA